MRENAAGKCAPPNRRASGIRPDMKKPLHRRGGVTVSRSGGAEGLKNGWRDCRQRQETRARPYSGMPRPQATDPRWVPPPYFSRVVHFLERSLIYSRDPPGLPRGASGWSATTCPPRQKIPRPCGGEFQAERLPHTLIAQLWFDASGEASSISPV